MRLDEDTLVEYLKIFAQTGISPLSPSVRRKPSTVPPVTEEEMLAAEAALGFALPPLLRRLYLEVSDGDFGPDLFKLDQEPHSRLTAPDSLVAWYLVMRSATQEEIDAAWGDTDDEDRPMVWPEKLLTIRDWGCNIYSCLDCSRPACPVLRNDNNQSFRMYALEAPSLHEWLEDWLDGKQLFWLDWEQAEKVAFPPG